MDQSSYIAFISIIFLHTTNKTKLGTSNVNQSHNSSINSTLHWFACVGGGEDNHQVTQIQENNFEDNKLDFDNIGGDEGTMSVCKNA